MPSLAQFPEKAFIKQILSRYASTAAADRFDDCIVIDPVELFDVPGLPFIVYSIDHPSRIRRPVPPGMEWRFYGRWIAGCTCGDVLAMGAQPHGFAVDLATPLDIDVTVIEHIYSGLSDVLSYYGAELQGGNLDVNPHLEVVGLCWGTVERSALIRRVGARCGDYIAVTSAPGIGWSSYLLHQYDQFTQLDEADRALLAEYNLMPVAPARAILEAARLPGAITSGMDLTDGLIEFFYTITERNGLGVQIKEDLIPLPEILVKCATLLSVPPSLLALDPGYDTPRIHGYTIARERWADVAAIFARYGSPLYRLGEVISTPDILWVPHQGPVRRIPPFWDDQFRKEQLVERWFALVEELR